MRTGRASVTILDSVHVEAYGSRMPLNQLAGLSVPEPTLIVAQPFDPSQLGAIEKAIRASDLGLNPSNDGKVVRIPIPALTEERRKELSRHVHKLTEEGRNSVRQVRRDANERLKKLLKDHKISEDDEKKGLDEVQKLTDSHIKQIDEAAEEEGRGAARPVDGRASVAERDAERLRRQQQVGVERHGLGLPHDFLERPRDDVRRSGRHHHAELAAPNQLHRLGAEPRRQHAIEAGRRAAPLQVTEHDRPRFLARLPGERFADLRADAAEPLDVRVVRLLDERLGCRPSETRPRRRRRC